MPSHPKFVSLEEFQEMIATSGALYFNIVNKDIGKYYNLSLETEVDELEMQKHMQMFKLEFYEGIARVADKIDFDSIKNESNTQSEKNKSRKNTKVFDQGGDSKANVKINDDNFENEMSQSNSSSISNNIVPENDMKMIIMSNFLKKKSLAFRLKKQD